MAVIPEKTEDCSEDSGEKYGQFACLRNSWQKQVT
jgi:hypothetical protein